MESGKLELVSTPDEKSTDPLTELLRSGAKALISKAVELELDALLANYRDMKLTNGRQVVVRNGYLPERTVQTGIGNLEVKYLKYVIAAQVASNSIALYCHLI